MTQERERILQKIKRVQALAERGIAGEQESAAATLERLMKQYGITEADIVCQYSAQTGEAVFLYELDGRGPLVKIQEAPRRKRRRT